MSNANSELVCTTCNKCTFDAIHDLCVLDYLNDVDVRVKHKFAKPKSVKSKKKKVWKPRGKVFTDVGYRWKPTGHPSGPLAEAVTTACYTQNHFLICKLHNKTSYELLHDKKPNLTYFYVFGALCYPTNDSEDLGKLKPKADIGIFFSYALAKKAFRIYNKQTHLIMETIHHPPSSTPYVPPTTNDWDMLFQPMFDEYLNPPSSDVSLVPAAAALRPTDPTGSPSSTSIDQAAPFASTSSTIQETQSPVILKVLKNSDNQHSLIMTPFSISLL
nr:retrovirus-related Pol polyprotein from transposon TNT 1-94 [Tanacetum cinerariifolium]